MNDNPFSKFSNIPSECIKIYGAGHFPASRNTTECFQILYSRHPPYTLELGGISFAQHPPFIYSCGAIIGIIRAVIEKIGNNCLQMKAQGWMWDQLPAVDFPTGVIPYTPTLVDASKVILHPQLGSAHGAAILGRENLVYDSDIKLELLFDFSSWICIGLFLTLLTFIEIWIQGKFSESFRSVPKKSQRKNITLVLYNIETKLSNNIGIFLGRYKLNGGLKWLHLLWAFSGVLLLTIASNGLLEILLQPPVSDRIKNFNQVLIPGGIPDWLKIYFVAGDRMDQLSDSGKKIVNNEFHRFSGERELYGGLGEIYSAIAAGTGIFFGNKDTTRGLMRWRLMTSYGVPHAYVTVDYTYEVPYFLPTSRANLSPAYTQIFDFMIQQWVASGLYDKLHERAAGKIFPAIHDPLQEQYEGGEVVTAPIPVDSFLSLIRLWSYSLVLPVITFCCESTIDWIISHFRRKNKLFVPTKNLSVADNEKSLKTFPLEFKMVYIREKVKV